MFKEKMYRDLRDEIEIYERYISGTAWNEQKKREKPVLFEFLINEKHKGNENSIYTELNQIFLECSHGTKDRKKFFDKAEQICKNRKNSINKDVKTLVKKVIAGEINVDNFSEKEMELLKDTLQTGILIAQAKAFLYDAGYPVENKKNKSDENASEPVGYVNKRRQDSILELVDLYLMRKGGGTFTSGASHELKSEEFKNQCLKTFSVLQAQKCDSIFLPLYIDSNTGSGIYIVGVNCLGESTLVESSRKWKRDGWKRFKCHFTYIGWLGIDMEEESISLYKQAFGDDLDRAIDFFEAEQEGSYAVFSDLNGKYISGLENKYMEYFDNNKITQEDIQKYEETLQNKIYKELK